MAEHTTALQLAGPSNERRDEFEHHYAGDYALVAMIEGERRIVGEAYRVVDRGARELVEAPALANARLWAAAPDLLAALELVANDIYNTVDGPDGSGVHAWSVSRRTEKALYDVLRKARGEQS